MWPFYPNLSRPQTDGDGRSRLCISQRQAIPSLTLCLIPDFDICAYCTFIELNRAERRILYRRYPTQNAVYHRRTSRLTARTTLLQPKSPYQSGFIASNFFAKNQLSFSDQRRAAPSKSKTSSGMRSATVTSQYMTAQIPCGLHPSKNNSGAEAPKADDVGWFAATCLCGHVQVSTQAHEPSTLTQESSSLL